MVPKHILIAGFSHITCFGIQLRSPDGNPRLVEVSKEGPLPVLGLEAPWPRQPEFLEQINKYASGQHLVLSWSGNEHITRFLFQSYPVFDFISSRFAHLPLDTEAEILPEALVETAFKDYSDRIDIAINGLKNSAASLWLIGPPPPKNNDERLRQHLVAEQRLAEALHRRGFDPLTAEFTAPIVRLKIWGLLWKTLESCTRRHDIRAIDPPSTTFDESGFLASSYSAPDVAHGNRAYGQAYLARIQNAIFATL